MSGDPPRSPWLLRLAVGVHSRPRAAADGGNDGGGRCGLHSCTSTAGGLPTLRASVGDHSCPHSACSAAMTGLHHMVRKLRRQPPPPQRICARPAVATAAPAASCRCRWPALLTACVRECGGDGEGGMGL